MKDQELLDTLHGAKLNATYLESLLCQGKIAAYSISNTDLGEKEYRIRIGFPAVY